MHRWSFQRLVRWLIPTLVYGIALCTLILEQKQTAMPHGLYFASDETYRTLAAARALAQRFQYELFAGTPMLAVRNVLPCVAVAIAGRLLNNYPAAMVMLGALLGWLTLLMLLRMARQLFPFPPFVLYTAILLIITPTFLTAAATGSPEIWSMALLAVTVAFHAEGLTDQRNPLGRWPIMSIGLLSLIRLEFLVLWILFAVHAALVSLLERRRDGTTGFVGIRFLTGLFVMALFVAPLIAWNLHAIRVPWPQAPGAPMTIDVLATRPMQEAFANYRAHVAAGIRIGFKALNAIPWMRGPLERWLTWTGALFIGILSFFRKDERPFSVIPWFFLTTPVLTGALYPIFGDAGLPVVFSALQPLGPLAAAFLIFRAPFLIESVYRKFKPGLPVAPGFQIWWAVAGGLLAAVSLARTVNWVAEHAHNLHQTCRARAVVQPILVEQHSAGIPVATDASGWWAYNNSEWSLIDLQGEGTPELLSCLAPNGRFDARLVKEFLREKNIGTVILWDPACLDVDDDYEPLRVNWSADLATWPRQPRLYELKPPGAL